MPTVFITGASHGLGLEFARQYSRDDWTVIASCRRPEEAEELKSLNVETIRLDVADPQSCMDAHTQVGDRPVDILLNNAGLMGEESQSALEADPDDWDFIFRTNVIAPATITKLFLPNLKKTNRPIGATMGSWSGIPAHMRGPDMVVYQSTKAAAHAVTISLGEALKPHGIIYVSFRPGRTLSGIARDRIDYLPEDSVRRLRDVAANLTMEHAGLFVDRTGEVLSYETGELI